MKQINVISISPELFMRQFEFPSDAHIQDIRVNFDTGHIDVKFSSTLCDSVPEGENIPYIKPHELKRRMEVCGTTMSAVVLDSCEH